MRICLISSVPLWSNPRLVKEADWLAARGHHVVAVTRCADRESDVADTQLLDGRGWHAVRLNVRRDDPAGRRRWLYTAIRARAAMELFRWTGLARAAEEGCYRGWIDALRAARRTRADLYIAHTQSALPIAARAAAASGVRFAFDCEDLLADEASDGLQDPLKRRAIQRIERRYLSRAAYVTATSRAMADALDRAYGVSARVVRNVFPLADLDEVAPPERRAARSTVELVWISATIGNGRGIDQALEALARMPDAVRLTLIGRMLPAFDPILRAKVASLGLAARVTIRPPVAPAAILRELSTYDVGLTLDSNSCLNRSLTICNKLFQYLQAGLLVAATDTPGQREVLDRVPAAGVLCAPGDAAALAAHLVPIVENRQALVSAQQAAWQAGREQYCWDREALLFQAAVDEALPRESNAFARTALREAASP